MIDSAGREHHEFVLDLSHDPAAREAAMEYVRQVERARPNLAADLRRLVTEEREW